MKGNRLLSCLGEENLVFFEKKFHSGIGVFLEGCVI